jgi:hypothetical protein
MARREGEFCHHCRDESDSEELIRFSEQIQRVRKRMAVWDNAPKPLLGANQKWVVKW